LAAASRLRNAKFSLPGLKIADLKACQCGEVLKGVIKPWRCKVFGGACTPETPLGALLVSSERACAAFTTIAVRTWPNGAAPHNTRQHRPGHQNPFVIVSGFA